jgi:hypothetical protein
VVEVEAFPEFLRLVAVVAGQQKPEVIVFRIQVVMVVTGYLHQ